MAASVRSLHLYPVKACRGLEVDTLTVGPTGPVGDRQWQVVDDDGRPLTQRQEPRLATVEVAVLDDGGLVLSAEGLGSVPVDAPQRAAAAGTVRVRPLVAPEVEAADGGDEVAAWLQVLLDRPARLAGVCEATDIRLPSSIDLWGHAISFVDAAPVLVANQASADWLIERASEPFGIDRFRANVIVDGIEPWVEDTWHHVTIGGVELDAEVPWPRCAVPQVDQRTGQRHREPALILKAHRWCDSAPSLPEGLRPIVEGSALFGVACDARPVGGRITVGDPVTVASTRDPVISPPET